MRDDSQRGDFEVFGRVVGDGVPRDKLREACVKLVLKLRGDESNGGWR